MAKKDPTEYNLLEDVAKQRIPGKTVKVGHFYPEELTLIKDKGHYLYDPRVEYGFDEDMVNGIMRVGLMTTIKCQKIYLKDKDKLILAVFDGRQGVINTCEANLRLEARGDPKLLVKVDIFEGTEAEMISRRTIANRHRREDDPVVCGFHARRALDKGIPMEVIQEDFRVGKETLENWMKLNDLHPEVQKMISAGELTQMSALRLRGLSPEKQRERAREIVTGSAPKNKAGGKNGRQHKGVDKRRIKRLCELKATFSKEASLILSWIAGDIDDAAVSTLINFKLLDKQEGKVGKVSKKKAAAAQVFNADAASISDIFKKNVEVGDEESEDLDPEDLVDDDGEEVDDQE